MQVHNGESTLLYSHFQLHIRRRKQTQVHLLQLEIAALQAAFSGKFEAVRIRKRKALDAVDERVNRITEIQHSLESTTMPARPREAIEEDPHSFLEVADSEVGFEKWVTPEERRAPVALLCFDGTTPNGPPP